MSLMIEEIADMDSKDVATELFKEYLSLAESVRILYSVNSTLRTQLEAAQQALDTYRNTDEGKE
jgi:hypothetical protein